MKDYFMTFNDSKKYIQIYEKIKSDIISGIIKPDSKIPSRRILAQSLSVSVNTINNAYDILLEEGYIYSIPKKGYYASDFSIPLNKKANSSKIEPINHANYLYDFSTSTPDYSLFPKSTFNKIVKTILSDNDFFNRDSYKGNISLRNQIKDHLFEEKGIDVDVNNIIIKDSTTTIINEIKQILNNPLTAIENPGYFIKNNVDNHPINLDNKGISISELKRNNYKLIITTPFSEFPLGIKMSIDRKNELINYLEEHDAYLIEDSLDSSFKNQAYKSTTLFSLSNRVIFTESFSKSIFPGLCISYFILPDKLLKIYEARYKNKSSNVSSLNQLVLKEFIRTGSYSRYLNKLRLSFIKKKKLVLDTLDNSLFDVVSSEPFTSIIIRPKFPFDKTNLSKVKISYLDDYYTQKSNEIILGFQAISYDNITRSINYLNTLFKETKKT